MDSRTARQREGIQRWKEAKCRGTWQWATGMGKTHTAITVIKLFQEKHPEGLTHIVCPTLYLQEQFHKALAAASLRNVQVFVINSYVRQARQCELLIADEVHLMIGENATHFPKIFTSLCQHNWVLALSATLTEEEQATLTSLGIPVCDTITLAEAQEHGWVNTCKTYNLGVSLTFEEEQQYKRWNDIFSSSFARFSHDFQLAMGCVSNAALRNGYAAQMGWRPELGNEHRWSPRTLGAAANQWLVASKNRQAIVNNATAKFQAALFLCHEHPVKTICFSESTDFASKLAALMPSICRPYHSNIASEKREYTVVKHYKTKPDVFITKTKSVGPATLRSEAIAAFAEAEHPVRVLSTAKALDQGADFAGLQLGIETSGNSSIRQKVQRTGRVVRVESDFVDKLAVYVHIYCLNTYEVNKLRRKQKGITGIIETTDIHQITF